MAYNRRWTVNAEIALIAWLDFCLQESCNYEESIVDHLQSAVNLLFTRNAILEHLRQMIRGVSLLGDELQEDLSMPASNLKDLFQKGSASLPNISQLRRNTIAKLVEEYAVKYKHGKTVNSPGNGSARQENWAPGPDALTPTSTELMNMRTSIERLQKLWQREVWQLQERQRISKEKQRELITQNKHLQAAMLDQHPPGHDHQAERLKFMNEIHDLQTRLDKNRQWDAFMQSFSEGSLLNTRKVDKLLLSIETELESIAHDSGCLFSPDLCPVEIGRDLCSLAQDPSETHINVNGSVARLESFLIKFGHPLALRWLTMAALQRWVFLTDFPNFLPEDTQLLHAYRRVIEKHLGGEKLRSLEIASHQTLIRDVAFTESLIPNRSKYLALKLCQALAPLFIRKMIVGDSARTSIWEEHQEVLNDMEARMQRIFAMALELKAESVLTDQTFVFLVHQPGTQTLGANTNASRLRSAETAEQMGLTRSRPWLHATLMIYPPSTSSDSSGVETATVCTRNFRVTPDGIEAGDCLYKRDILIANHEGHAGTLREGFACSAARELPPYVLETHGENHGTVSSQANNGSKASFNIQDQPVNEEGQDPATTNIAESLECDRCGKHFKQALYRKNHQKNEVCVRCERCQKWVPSKLELKLHQEKPCTQITTKEGFGAKKCDASAEVATSPLLGKRPSNSRVYVKQTERVKQRGQAPQRNSIAVEVPSYPGNGIPKPPSTEIQSMTADNHTCSAGRTADSNGISPHPSMGKRVRFTEEIQEAEQNPRRITGKDTHTTETVSETMAENQPLTATRHMLELPLYRDEAQARDHQPELPVDSAHRSLDLDWDAVGGLDDLNMTNSSEDGTDFPFGNLFETDQPTTSPFSGSEVHGAETLPAAQSLASSRPFNNYNQFNQSLHR